MVKGLYISHCRPSFLLTLENVDMSVQMAFEYTLVRCLWPGTIFNWRGVYLTLMLLVAQSVSLLQGGSDRSDLLYSFFILSPPPSPSHSLCFYLPILICFLLTIIYPFLLHSIIYLFFSLTIIPLFSSLSLFQESKKRLNVHILRKWYKCTC